MLQFEYEAEKRRSRGVQNDKVMESAPEGKKEAGQATALPGFDRADRYITR